MSLSLHIISFDIPFPPNYGGVIDVFYKLKALNEAGVKITLHCFVYGKRKPDPNLNKYCEKVYYYPRTKIWRQWYLPFIVESRRDPELLKNLLKDEAPILFEGTHSCYYLTHPKLAYRKKLVRMHNIEHDYYALLSKSENSFLKRMYCRIESVLLKAFEKKLGQAEHILAISEADEKELKLSFGNKVLHLPPFHGHSKLRFNKGMSDFCLYHGKLSVGENEEAALYLVNEVFCNLDVKLVIAGDGISEKLRKAASGKTNITLLDNPGLEEIDRLVEAAQVHVLPTFQPTGIKLKLIHVLFSGRFVVCNQQMVAGNGLAACCKVAENATDMQALISECMQQEFSEKELTEREKVLGKRFSDEQNALILRQLLN